MVFISDLFLFQINGGTFKFWRITLTIYNISKVPNLEWNLWFKILFTYQEVKGLYHFQEFVGRLPETFQFIF